jgi:hypothetical protein
MSFIDALAAASSHAPAIAAPDSRFAILKIGLPQRAAIKLRDMRDRAEELRAGLLSISDRLREDLRPQKWAAEESYRAVTDPAAALRMGSRALRDDDQVVIERKRRLDAATAAFDHGVDVQSMREARLHAITGPLARVEDYLKRQTGPEFLAVDGVAAELMEGETFLSAVESLRNSITGLVTELHRIGAAPIPSSVVKQRLAAKIDDLARLGRVDLFGTVERGDPPIWPTEVYRADVFASAATKDGPAQVVGVINARIPNAIALLAWLFKDRLTAALDAEIDALADDEHSLSDEERRSRERAVREEILQVEYREEASIEAAEAAGQFIARRDNADPRAVLGITGPMP